MTTPTKRLWIDTDVVLNRAFHDVDDALAMVMALQHPAWRVVGISLNQRVDNAARVTQRLLASYATYTVPVYKGANDVRSSFGQTTAATQPLIDALREGPLTIVAIGALTNLATVLDRHPELAGQIDDLVCCAGRRRGQRFFAPNSRIALPDANFDNDVRSFERVLQSHAPITLAGFDAAAGIVITNADITRIASSDRPDDRWLAHRLRVWARLWRVTLGIDGFIPFDACTIGHVLYPQLFQHERQLGVVVSERENDARHWSRLAPWSRPARKHYLEVGPDAQSSRQVDYAHSPDPTYKDVIMAHLLRVPRITGARPSASDMRG